MKNQTAARSSILQPVRQPRTAGNGGQAQTLRRHDSGADGHRGRHNGSIPEFCRIGQTDTDRGQTAAHVDTLEGIRAQQIRPDLNKYFCIE